MTFGVVDFSVFPWWESTLKRFPKPPMPAEWQPHHNGACLTLEGAGAHPACITRRGSMAGTACPIALQPRGGVRPFHQTSTCLAQSTLEPNVVQSWSRNTLKLRGSKTLGLHRVDGNTLNCNHWFSIRTTGFERILDAKPANVIYIINRNPPPYVPTLFPTVGPMGNLLPGSKLPIGPP